MENTNIKQTCIFFYVLYQLCNCCTHLSHNNKDFILFLHVNCPLWFLFERDILYRHSVLEHFWDFSFAKQKTKTIYEFVHVLHIKMLRRFWNAAISFESSFLYAVFKWNVLW